MKKEQKVYFIGNVRNSKNIIQTLEKLGGINYKDIKFCTEDKLYYIDNEYIESTDIKSEIGKIIKDNYKEIKLPELWKDGDILIDRNSQIFAIFKEYCNFNKNFFIAYFTCVNKKIHNYRDSFLKSNFTLADVEEIYIFYDCLINKGIIWDFGKRQFVKISHYHGNKS